MSGGSEPLAKGAIAVIFSSRRRDGGEGDADYDAAARAMEAEAARQPGYLGFESVRGEDREGITISYWADEASALRWRDHAEHAATRARGRAEWYDRYRVVVAEVTRSYRWER